MSIKEVREENNVSKIKDSLVDEQMVSGITVKHLTKILSHNIIIRESSTMLERGQKYI